MQIRIIGIVLAVGVATHGIAPQAAELAETPSQLYGQLFEDVQMQRLPRRQDIRRCDCEGCTGGHRPALSQGATGAGI